MYKKYLIRATIYLTLIFVLDIALGFINDPYMIFHKPWTDDKYYFKDMRKQAAGIINTHEFDSIILGTSMMQNTSFEEASSEFNANFVNISIGGGLISERGSMLRYALDRKYIKNVIMTLDVFDNYGEDKSHTLTSNFSFLYDDSFLNDIKFYVGFNKAGYLFCGNLIFQNNCPFTVKNLNKATEWYSDIVNQRRFGGVENWINYSDDPQIKSAFKRIVSKVEGKPASIDKGRVLRGKNNDQFLFKDNVLKYIDENPEVDFYLFFPPYHRLKHVMWKKYDPSQYEIYKNRVESIVSLAENYNNVQVFGYDNFSFVDDISIYKDRGHYHPKINSLILQWMKNGDGELKPDMLQSYFNEVDKKINEYDLQNIIDLIKHKLEKDDI